MVKARILIVEDEAIIAMELESQLQSLGYEVTSMVDTGEKAIRKADADKPDLILMDIRIKGEMDGISAAEEIRNRFGIPVIFSTAYLDEERIERAKITMPFGYVLKPIQERDLKVTIEMALYVAKVDKDRKKAEETLRIEKSLTEEYINSLPGLFFVFDGERFIRWNEQWEKVTGYSESEISKMYAPNFFEGPDRTLIEERMLEVFTEGKSEAEAELVTKQGNRIPYFFNGLRKEIKGKQHIVGLGVDITEHKLMERELSDERKRFQILVDGFPLGVSIINAENQYQYVNPKFVEMFGYTLEDIPTGDEWFNQAFPDEQYRSQVTKEWKNALQEIHGGESLPHVLTVRCKNEEQKEIQFLIVTMITGEHVTIYQDTTDHKRIEDELLATRQQFEDIIQSLPDPTFVIDKEKKIVSWNRAIEEMTGLSREEMIGKGDNAYSVPFWKEPKQVLVDLIMDHDLDDVLPYDSIEKHGDALVSEAFLPKIGGAEGMHVWLKASPLTDENGNVVGAIEAIRDITEKKRAEEELRQLRNYLSNIINSMPSMLVGVDLDSKVTQWNKTAEDITGIAANSALGQYFFDLFPQMKSETNKIAESIQTQEIKQELKRPRLSENGTRYEDVTIYPLVAGGMEGAVIRIDDVTDKVGMEKTIIQTEKMVSVGGLAAGMAHELNNPLGGILQGVQNVQRRLSPDLKSNHEPAKKFGIDLQSLQSYLERREILTFLNGIKDSGEKASRIISNMLQFSRKSESQMAPTNLVELMESAIELSGKDYDLKKKHDFRKIKLVREFDSKLPLVPCTETEIEQVVLNLLNNAAYAMSEENQKGLCQLTIRLLKDRHMARIEIEDNGPGMDEKVRKRIFEPFFTTKPVGEGTGLGLSVSYMIITNNHKGTMEVESEIGKGTKFIIHLPLDRELVS